MTTINKQLISPIIALALLAAGSALASEITGGLSNQGLVPTAPSSVSTSTGNQITVIWSAVAGVDGYKVYRKKNSENFQLIPGNVTVLSYIDSGLSDGTYSYQVQPFLGTLSPDLNNIAPTLPISIVTPTSTPTSTSTPTTPSGGGGGGGGEGGGGGGVTPPSTPTSTLSAAAQKVDANKDNKIDVLDFNALMVNWGKTTANNVADFNSDGKVNIFDFNLLMINWTK